MIRPARPADVPAILDLVRELAVYQREPVTTVVATEEDLHTALFGSSPAVFAHVADDGDEVRAVAIWFVSFSTWLGRHGMHLEDLIVSERARGTGIGLALFDELRRICVERGYPRLDWQALDWNATANSFYERRGAHRLAGSVSWRLNP